MKVWELIEKLSGVDKDAEVVGISDHDASAGCEYKMDAVEVYTMTWHKLDATWAKGKPLLCKEAPKSPSQPLLLPGVKVVALTGGKFLMDG